MSLATGTEISRPRLPLLVTNLRLCRLLGNPLELSQDPPSHHEQHEARGPHSSQTSERRWSPLAGYPVWLQLLVAGDCRCPEYECSDLAV